MDLAKLNDVTGQRNMKDSSWMISKQAQIQPVHSFPLWARKWDSQTPRPGAPPTSNSS